MPNNSGERRRPQSDPSVSELWDTFLQKNQGRWNEPDYLPWDSPEYEALCKAEHDIAYRKACEKWGHSGYSFELNKNYSEDLLARPTGWETCPNPTPQHLESLWYHPLPGYHCPICGSSKHYETCCSYLVSFPSDGRLHNHEDYEVVCQCGEPVVDRTCPTGFCHPNRPQRVVTKSSRNSIVCFGVDNISRAKPPYDSVPNLLTYFNTPPMIGDLY